ncbi:MAG: CD1845 family protein [Lachnospiraceae bacterium]
MANTLASHQTLVSFKGGIDGSHALFDFLIQFDAQFKEKHIQTAELFAPIIENLIEKRSKLCEQKKMMKRTLRFALTPFMLIARLMLGLAAFISSIASAVIGLTVGLFAVLSVIEFAIGYWQNGIAFMVLALLASPIGLPAVANFLLNRMDHILGFFEGLLC